MPTKPKSAEEAASDALGPQNVADFQAQLAALRADLSAMATTLAAMSKTGSDHARQAAAGAYADLKSKGGESLNDATAQAGAALDGVADYARKNPLQSLGIAAGLGMMLGLLFGRR